MTVSPPPSPLSVPSTAEPTTQDLVFEAIQDCLIVAGACGVAIPPMLQSTTVETQIAGGVAGLIGLGMSIYDQWRKARAAHASAVASAKAMTPRRVV